MGGAGSGKKVNLSKDELLEDIQRVAELDATSNNPTSSEYNKYGIVSSTLCALRFGSWSSAKKQAGFSSCKKSSRQHKQVNCFICGSQGSRISDKEYNNPYRCSRQCKARYRYPKYVCEYCDNSFRGKRSLRENNDLHFCDRDCRADYERKSGYNSNQQKRWANKVKEKYDYICQQCGEKYDVMCAHHNPPKRKLSEDEMKNVDNGVCLCYPCHADRHSGGQRKALLGWWEWYTSDE